MSDAADRVLESISTICAELLRNEAREHEVAEAMGCATFGLMGHKCILEQADMEMAPASVYGAQASRSDPFFRAALSRRTLLISRAHSFAVVVFISVLASCRGGDNGDGRSIELGPQFQCLDRPDDMSGYLQPICWYIVSTLRQYEIDPNTLEIESITADGDVDQVRMSCCFTGDIAVMDRATRTVVSFSLGDH